MAQAKGKRRLERVTIAVLALLAGLAGWVGLIYLTAVTQPTTSTWPAVFALFFFSVTATSLPFTLWLDGRMRRPKGRLSQWRPLRQSAGLGLWAALCAWLQLMRLLDWMTASLFLLILILVEWLIHSRK